MSQPPWIPPAGGASSDPDDEASYRGAHSSGNDDAPPPTDDVWGGPGQSGPWGPAADQPWSGGDQWAGAKSGWSTGPDADGPDDSGPAYPVPVTTPRPAPDATPTPAPAASGPGPAAGPPPDPWAAGGSPTLAGAGYGPPSYADPGAPSAGPARGEPGYGQPGYGQPDPAYRPQPQPGQNPAGPPPNSPGVFPPGGSALPPYVAGPTSSGPAPQPPEPGAGEPFRAVRSEAVPPAGPTPDRDLAARDLAGPTPAGAPGPRATGTDGHGTSAPPTYTPADPPPTPRPPQPELPDSMSDVPQYAARLAAAPLPDGSAPPPQQGGDPAGPAWGVPPDQRPSAENAAAFAGAAGPPPGWPQQAGGPAHAAGGTPPPPAMPRPEDLLVSSRPRTLEKPATWGWRGRLARMSGGAYKPKPSQAELADRQAKLNAQRGFSRPMTVVVIQPKGGAGKTPTTICVSSALGVRRGGYIVGWDNNETRGTLAVRTTNDDNQRTTAWDLLGRLDEFERSEARVGDLGYYMRAQGDAQFDALVSDDNPGNMAQIGEVEFKRIHQVLQRFYRMIIIDTGNNVRSTNWQAAVDHADQIVVVSTYQRDVGYSGSWVLDHLAQTGRDELARDAITVLTAAEPTVDQVVQGELVKHFSQRTRAVVEVPYDAHIAEGGPIRWAELSEGSKRAWTSVAAAITQTLYDRDQRQLAARGRPGG